MLKVYTSGLPLKAMGILTDALNQVLGENVYQIEELGKDMLKATVRLSKKNPNVVLVVLDNVSTDLCKDIENGLYSSDKFITYVDNKSFIEFLNSKYSLDLFLDDGDEEESLVTKETSSEKTSGGEVSDIIEEYESKLSGKEFIIKNLRVKLKDMQSKLDGMSTAKNYELECEALRDEIISLKNELLSSNNKVEELNSQISLLNSKKSLNTDDSKIESLTKELTELRSLYSIQSSVVQDREDRVKALQSRVSELENNLAKKEEDYRSLSMEYSKACGDLDSIKIELSGKDRELVRYLKELTDLKGKQISSSELEVANASIESLKSELSDLMAENSNLSKSVSASERKISSLESELTDHINALHDKDAKIQELEDRIAEDNDTIAQLNKDTLALRGKLEVFGKISTGGEDPEELYDELLSARRELSELKEGVFGKIASMALPKGTQRIRLLSDSRQYKNVRFIFAGSTSSRKGAYRCMYNNLQKADGKDKFLIVDLVSETSVDYVFMMSKVVSGIDWFRKGGSVQAHVSKTSLKNVDVLSAGLSYINDSYFLCIDWDKRLQELENSGYQVLLFCGDLSNMVGRVLHESFAGMGTSLIYTQGNAIGARTLIANLRGLTNADKSGVGYFDYNPSVKRFVDVVKQTNRCVILNTLKR